MINKVEQYIKKWNMISKEDRLIVGVSGGADSICLLFVLLELQKRIPFEMVIVHVNHGLRGGDADADEDYVRQICSQYGLTFVVYSENIELVAKKRKQSTEEAGRNVRREAFWHTMEEYGGTKIVLAHHKNDNVETFLMNLARGTGVKGLGGIRPEAGVFVRPLLCLERREIEAFLEERRIPYCIDTTNESDAYTRNRIRNHVIPYMEKEVNSCTVAHVNAVMEQLQELQAYMEEQTNHYYELCVRKIELGYIVNKDSLNEVPRVFKPLLLKKTLVQLCESEKDIEEIHLKSLQELFEKQVGKQIDLPYGMRVKRTYEGVSIKRKYPLQEEDFQVDINFSEGTHQVIEYKNVHVTCRLLEKEDANEMYLEKVNKKMFDYDIITHGVCIRTRKPGDYITIHPDGRTQKLKSFFVNEKIPQEKRDEVLLVADGHHILWIVGLRVNCIYQVGKHTKRVLEIQVDKGENYGRDN